MPKTTLFSSKSPVYSCPVPGCTDSKDEWRKDHLKEHLSCKAKFLNGKPINPDSMIFKKLTPSYQLHSKYYFDNNLQEGQFPNLKIKAIAASPFEAAAKRPKMGGASKLFPQATSTFQPPSISGTPAADKNIVQSFSDTHPPTLLITTPVAEPQCSSFPIAHASTTPPRYSHTQESLRSATLSTADAQHFFTHQQETDFTSQTSYAQDLPLFSAFYSSPSTSLPSPKPCTPPTLHLSPMQLTPPSTGTTASLSLMSPTPPPPISSEPLVQASEGIPMGVEHFDDSALSQIAQRMCNLLITALPKSAVPSVIAQAVANELKPKKISLSSNKDCFITNKATGQVYCRPCIKYHGHHSIPQALKSKKMQLWLVHYRSNSIDKKFKKPSRE